MRLLLSAPGATAQRLPDPKLLALLAKAHDWLGELTSGRSRSVAVIANAQRVTSAYVMRVVHLAFLAPDLVQCITRGEAPPELNAKRLLGAVPLPLDWDQQRVLLGFER